MKLLLVLFAAVTVARSDGPYAQQSSQGLSTPQQQQQVSFKSEDAYGPPSFSSGSFSSASAPYPSSSGQSQAQYSTSSGPYPAHAEGPYPPSADESDSQQYSSSQSMDNPSYDPNLYQNFVPQDSVQQYVTSYGGPYAPGSEPGALDGFGGGVGGPGAAGAAGGVGFPIGGGGGVGFPGNYPMGGIPYGPGGIPYGPGFGPAGFSVQSGYEGFLVPSIPPPPPPPPYGGGAYDVLRTILPRSVASIFMRSGSYLLQTIAVVLFGGAVTTAICTLTPLCTISFAALPLLGLRTTVKNVKDTLSKEVTTDRVARAAEFVQNALVKYQKLQLEHTPVDAPTKELISTEVPKSN